MKKTYVAIVKRVMSYNRNNPYYEAYESYEEAKMACDKATNRYKDKAEEISIIPCNFTLDTKDDIITMNLETNDIISYHTYAKLGYPRDKYKQVFLF